ncbi:MAG: NYN domain-containing protein, partial [Sedimenticolaceae bacterium]
MKSKTRIALLIDCDNVSHTSIEGVLQELAKYGTVNVRHAHGDWNSRNLAGWREKLQPNAVRPIQQFAYTTGKNATDSAMIIDAMDLLYSKTVDAFALMTSDSDFTPLV